MTGTVILNVVIVLGIIVAGGFLIFFMGDFLMSLCNPKKDDKTVKAKKEKEEKRIKEKIDQLSPETAEEVKAMPEVADLVYGGAVVEAYNPEEEEPVSNEDVEETEETDEEEETEEDDDQDDYIAERRRELMARLARMAEEEEETEDEDEEEETEETEEETEEEKTVETVDTDETDEEPVEETEEVEDVEEETETASEEPAQEKVDETAEELAALRRELEEARRANANLQSELANRAIAQAPVAGEEVLLSEEDYVARLAEQEENLKQNEKELRACKKEYIPLRKVKKTLENDEKKLRRKEALVAKQKVVLYGVNNYSDIDEEKAKKLAEDLDLLDGLKLSVEHCQEVMNKNKERYPLLEKMFNILTAQNDEIRASIARTQEELAKVRAKKNND